MTVRTYTDMVPTFPDRATWTLPWALRHRAQTHADEVFLDVPHQDRRLTFAQMLTESGRIAGGLLDAGGEPGDRVLIMAPNSAEVVLTWFGSALAGMVEVPINTAYSGRFLEHQVRTTAPRFAIVDAALAAHFAAGDRSAHASIERYYVLGSGDALAEAVATLESAGCRAAPFQRLATASPRALPLPVVGPTDVASIFFTSGTTGLSKGVTMSHSHLSFFAQEFICLTRLTDADTHMSVGPLFHGNAQFLAAYPCLQAGARFVLRQRYSATRWIDQIRDCGATVTNFVGVMMDWTFKQPERRDDSVNVLRCIYAVPTAATIAEPFRLRFGVEAFVENYGMTEISMPVLTPYGEERPPGAAGLLVEDFFEVRIVDPDTDEDVEVGEVGELVVRGKVPWTMLTDYYNMPNRTAEAQRNLWFHTGDGLKRDAEGWYYFVDRLKDAIRRRGENISSFEVEQAVMSHAGIVDCAAVAVPAAAHAGEDEVVIFAVLAPDATLELEDVRLWCKQQLPAFAMPEHIALLPELPMTPSGKVRKVVLREQAVGLTQEARGARASG